MFWYLSLSLSCLFFFFPFAFQCDLSFSPEWVHIGVFSFYFRFYILYFIYCPFGSPPSLSCLSFLGPRQTILPPRNHFFIENWTTERTTQCCLFLPWSGHLGKKNPPFLIYINIYIFYLYFFIPFWVLFSLFLRRKFEFLNPACLFSFLFYSFFFSPPLPNILLLVTIVVLLIFFFNLLNSHFPFLPHNSTGSGKLGSTGQKTVGSPYPSISTLSLLFFFFFYLSLEKLTLYTIKAEEFFLPNTQYIYLYFIVFFFLINCRKKSHLHFQEEKRNI